MDKKIVTFGEIMIRVDAPGHRTFRQGLPGPVDFSFAGAEANVAASLALFGRKVSFVTALPRHSLAQACTDTLRGLGVETSSIVHTDEGRLGLYFVEKGANQRPSRVVYDRDWSSIALAGPESYDWQAILSDAGWLHVSGITPALSRHAAQATIEAVATARNMGLTVSCDLNFRNKLWKWDPACTARELAGKTMPMILEHVDVLIGNEEDAHDVLGIKAGSTNVDAGQLDVQRYPDVARQIADRFPSIRLVAFTLRESVSADHNNWGAVLWNKETDTALFSPSQDGQYRPYAIKDIVDRIGGGDAFSGGLLYGLTDSGLQAPLADALDFATAASCLCHSIEGDFNFAQKEDILSLMRGNSGGRVKR